MNIDDGVYALNASGKLSESVALESGNTSSVQLSASPNPVIHMLCESSSRIAFCVHYSFDLSLHWPLVLLARVENDCVLWVPGR